MGVPWRQLRAGTCRGRVRTDDKVGRELVRDRHDDLLECVDVVCVRHALFGEGDVDGAVEALGQELLAGSKTRTCSQALASVLADLLGGPVRATGVERAVVAVQRDV